MCSVILWNVNIGKQNGE